MKTTKFRVRSSKTAMMLFVVLGFCACPTNHAHHTHKNGDTKENPPPERPMTGIDQILAHQTKRFETLKTILAKDSKYHVKFPGKSAEEHKLGTGIAATEWKVPAEHKRMIEHITTQINDLANKFPGRVHFGFIGDYKLAGRDCDRSQPNPQGLPGLQADGTFMIHVWGANAGNFNYPDQHPGSGWGGGQATCFEKQRVGVFGISTMPPENGAALMADDKLLPLY